MGFLPAKSFLLRFSHLSNLPLCNFITTTLERQNLPANNSDFVKTIALLEIFNIKIISVIIRQDGKRLHPLAHWVKRGVGEGARGR